MATYAKNLTAVEAAVALTDKEFEHVCKLIRDMTGISMRDTKRQLVMRRIAGRLKALQMHSVSEYLALLESGDPSEVESFNNAVTTNLTSFFREKHHFDYLQSHILPELIAKKGCTTKRLRIWSAGCSTGEESYSIAMTLKTFASDLSSWDARILSTDLDTDALRSASAGVYKADRVACVPEGLRRKWLQRCGETYRARAALTSMLTFKSLNLMHDWPMRGKFDVIFCRNVVIYFEKPTQRALMERYAEILEDGGYLILGHSESLYNVSDRFELIGKTIYRKVR